MYFREHNGLAGRDQLKLLQTIVWSASEQTKNFTAAMSDRPLREVARTFKFQEMKYRTAPVSAPKQFLNAFAKKLPKLQGLLQKTSPSGSVVFRTLSITVIA
jgi:hypothetical protein